MAHGDRSLLEGLCGGLVSVTILDFGLEIKAFKSGTHCKSQIIKPLALDMRLIQNHLIRVGLAKPAARFNNHASKLGDALILGSYFGIKLPFWQFSLSKRL